MPFPAKKKGSPLPPFMFARNNLNKLEFRMNIRKPIGCVQFKLPLDEVRGKPGHYHAWSGHLVTISFLPEGKDYAIAYYKGHGFQAAFQMSMLMGRTLDKNPEAKQVFEELMDQKKLSGTVIYPSTAETCVLAKET